MRLTVATSRTSLADFGQLVQLALTPGCVDHACTRLRKGVRIMLTAGGIVTVT